MLDPKQLQDLDGEVAALRSRLADLETAQSRRRLFGVAFVALLALVGGTAWAATGNCPNGMTYCFVADRPALASEVNYDFSELRDLNSAYVSQIGGGVPSTQAAAPVTSLSLPAGSYVVSGKLYAISSTTAGNHTLLCSLRSSEGSTSIDFTNSNSAPTTYNNLSLLGATTLNAAGTVSLSCSSGPDAAGAYTFYGIALVATRVAALR